MLLQEGVRRFRSGSCCCREVVAGSGLAVAAAGQWSPGQEDVCWHRKVVTGAGLVVAGAVSVGIRLDIQN